MKITTLASLGAALAAAGMLERAAAADAAGGAQGLVWNSPAPADCPFPKSATLSGIAFTGRHSDYRCGDTWYPSWAGDGNLYSPWTDGTTEGLACSSGDAATAKTGHAVMIGEDPLKLTIRNTGPLKQASALPYHGRYPAGSLVFNGIWYYGTYCLGPEGSTAHNGFTWNWPNLGPMPGFQISRDLGCHLGTVAAHSGQAAVSRAAHVPRAGEDGRAALRGFRQKHATFARWQGVSVRYGSGGERFQSAAVHQAGQTG